MGKELRKLRAEKKGVTVKVLSEKDYERSTTHPTVRRVVGKFAKKLQARVNKKQFKRKQRLRRVARFYKK